MSGTIKNKMICGIEIARIISMYMIVLLHCLGRGGILKNVESNTLNYYLSFFIENLCFCAVNVYGLISGYVCISSKTKYTRIINLWLEVFIFSVSISTLLYFLPQFHIGKGELLFSFFPVLSGEYWYFSAYVCVFAVMPLLNKAILHIKQQSLFRVLLLGFVIFSLFSIVGYLPGGDVFKLAQGYSPMWLMYLYVLGAYIRLYGFYNLKKYVYLLMYIIFSLFNFLVFLCVKNISYYFSIIGDINFLVYNSPFIILSAVSLLLYLLKIDLSRFNNFILKISSVSFYVYIISTHPLVFSYIQRDIIKGYANSNSLLLLLVLLICSSIIYFSCTIIGLLFKKLFSLIRLQSFADYLVRIIRKIYGKFITLLKFV